MAQGKGPAYERWAKVYNLKRRAFAPERQRWPAVPSAVRTGAAPRSTGRNVGNGGREQKREADVLCYQIRQSFAPGEITPEEANRVGYETAMRYSPDGLSETAQWFPPC